MIQHKLRGVVWLLDRDYGAVHSVDIQTTVKPRSWFPSNSPWPQCAVFTLRGMEIKLHLIEPQKDNLQHLNDPFRQRVASECVLFPRKRGFMATVGDPETPDQDVFYLCFLRLLLIQQPHSTATTIRTNNGSKLTLLFPWWWWWLQATRPALSRPSFSDDRSSILFTLSLLSPLSRICFFFNLSYKLFHILINFRRIRPRSLSSLFLFPLFFI